MAKNVTGSNRKAMRRPAPRRAAKSCAHVVVQHRWAALIERVAADASQYIAARWCLKCGAVLSLGASNDAPEAVQIEMRAAELEAAAREESSYLPPTASVDESHGWQDHAPYDSGGPDHLEWRAEWQAGWLARAMFVHGEEVPDAWTWDITRPLAEQGEPWLSSHACCDSCAHGLPCACTDEPTGHDGGFNTTFRFGAPEVIGLTPRQVRAMTSEAVAAEDALRDHEVTARNAERIAEQTRHDVASSVARHADLAPAKDESTGGEP